MQTHGLWGKNNLKDNNQREVTSGKTLVTFNGHHLLFIFLSHFLFAMALPNDQENVATLYRTSEKFLFRLKYFYISK